MDRDGKEEVLAGLVKPAPDLEACVDEKQCVSELRCVGHTDRGTGDDCGRMRTTSDGVDDTKEANPLGRPGGVGEAEVDGELHVGNVPDQAELVVEDLLIRSRESRRRDLGSCAVPHGLLLQTATLVSV